MRGKDHKLIVSVDACGNVVAWDAGRVIQAAWEGGGGTLRLWFGGETTPPVVLDGAVAQAAWERVVGLQTREV